MQEQIIVSGLEVSGQRAPSAFRPIAQRFANDLTIVGEPLDNLGSLIEGHVEEHAIAIQSDGICKVSVDNEGKSSSLQIADIPDIDWLWTIER